MRAGSTSYSVHIQPVGYRQEKSGFLVLSVISITLDNKNVQEENTNSHAGVLESAGGPATAGPTLCFRGAPGTRVSSSFRGAWAFVFFPNFGLSGWPT